MRKIKSLLEKISEFNYFNEIVKLKDILYSLAVTQQKEIIEDTLLNDSFNGAIIKVKSSCTIKIPEKLVENFSCVFRTFAGTSATFVKEKPATILDAPQGTILGEFKMATLFKDGILNTYILQGELA